jgi:hypothetical protein
MRALPLAVDLAYAALAGLVVVPVVVVLGLLMWEAVRRGRDSAPAGAGGRVVRGSWSGQAAGSSHGSCDDGDPWPEAS